MNENELPKITKRSTTKIYRSRTDRIVFGVCGGIAEYYQIESLWVRVIFIFLGITGAIGFLLYLSLALLMPLAPLDSQGKEEQKQTPADLSRRLNFLGLVIILIGIIAFFNALFPQFWLGWKIIWPVAIILIGLSFISE